MVWDLEMKCLNSCGRGSVSSGWERVWEMWDWVGSFFSFFFILISFFFFLSCPYLAWAVFCGSGVSFFLSWGVRTVHNMVDTYGLFFTLAFNL